MIARLVAGEISRALGEQIERLAPDLLPLGRRESGRWRVGSLAGEPGSSLSVQITGHRRGLWLDHATGESGDALDLARGVLELETRQAIEWATRWLGTDQPQPRHQPAPAPKPPPDDTVARHERALEIWRSAQESICGTPAAKYLSSRGVDPARLSSLWGLDQWPATLRFSERAGLDPQRPCRALVIAVHGAESGLVTAIHRILLDSNGNPVLDKRGRKRKLLLGPVSGNAARFDWGPAADGRWGIAEGPETALIASQLTGGMPVWSSICSGNMARVSPPSWARHATIFSDNDDAGMAAATETLRRYRTLPQLETVRVLTALHAGSDMADLAAGEP